MFKNKIKIKYTKSTEEFFGRNRSGQKHFVFFILSFKKVYTSTTITGTSTLTIIISITFFISRKKQAKSKIKNIFL